MNMFLRSAIVLILFFSQCASAYEQFNERNDFHTLEQFRQYLVEKELAISYENIYLETLYSFSDNLRVVRAVDRSAGMMGGGWPIFVLWDNDKNIRVVQLGWSPLSSRVAHGEQKYTHGEQILNGYKDGKVYTLYSSELLKEIPEYQDEHEEMQCSIQQFLYIIAIKDSTKSLELLTKEPVPLTEVRKCNIAAPNDLLIESKDSAFLIKGRENIAPELSSWTGEYIVLAGSIWRIDDTSTMKVKLKKANDYAISYYRKNEVGKAVNVMMPLVEYGPSELDSDTVSIYNNYAFFLAEKHEYVKSLRLLEKILAMFPDRAVAQLNVADVYYEMHELQKASIHYKKYIDLMTEKNKKGKIPGRVKSRIDGE